MSKDNFKALEEMIYSGRGITVGKTPSGNFFIGYSLTGRSSFSQARELLQGRDTGIIRVSAITDESRLKKMFNITDKEQLVKLQENLKKGSPALTIYPAINPLSYDTLIASNGAQTKLLYQKGFETPESLIESSFKEPFFEYDEKEDRWIDITTYEPDAPNNTPRISACVKENKAAMHLVWEDQGKKKQKIFPLYLYSGKGKLITTYFGENENPLAPFQGEPLNVEISSGSANDIAESIYTAIHGGQEQKDNYRVAAAVIMLKPGGLETAIINRVDRGD